MCATEIAVPGAMPRVVRLLAHVETDLPRSGSRTPTCAGLPLCAATCRADVTADLLVVGSGLIGTSIGLALRGQRDGALHDPSAQSLAVAVERGAGRRWDGTEAFAHCLVAAPPPPSPGCAAAALPGGRRTATSRPCSGRCRRRSSPAVPLDRVCGSHPMAGKEQSGPAAAVASLFVGRPWVLCPSAATSQRRWRRCARWRRLRRGAGRHDAEEHDAAVALVSHLPQVAASAVAAVLAASGGPLALAGTGAAGHHPHRRQRPGAVGRGAARERLRRRPLVLQLGLELVEAGQALGIGDLEPVELLLRKGNEGRERVPRKRGEVDRDFVPVSVSVPDRPGQIGRRAGERGRGRGQRRGRTGGAPARPPHRHRRAAGAPRGAGGCRRALAEAGWDVLGG
jgi:prephenate dehydrogenase